MKETPILFSTDMVNKILSGEKTQTRRAIKVQPTQADMVLGEIIDTTSPKNKGKLHWFSPNGVDFEPKFFNCPFGKSAIGFGFEKRGD